MKVGDVVMLKSGGPKMTVLSIEEGIGGGRAFCGWFTSDCFAQFTYFQVSALKEVKE